MFSGAALGWGVGPVVLGVDSKANGSGSGVCPRKLIIFFRGLSDSLLVSTGTGSVVAVVVYVSKISSCYPMPEFWVTLWARSNPSGSLNPNGIPKPALLLAFFPLGKFCSMDVSFCGSDPSWVSKI